MVAPALLASIQDLSVADKLALITAISQMLQNELQSQSTINGHAKVEQPESKDSVQLSSGELQTSNQDMKALIAELLSRPDPTPEQMLPRGLLKGMHFDEEDFRAAEWHPSEKELLGE